MEILFAGVLLVLCTIDCAVSQDTNSSFITEPSNLTTFIGAPTVFNCSYPGENLEAELTWMLNGEFITMNANNSCVRTRRFKSSQPKYTTGAVTIQHRDLIIRNVIRECNGSILQCVLYETFSGFSMIIDRSRKVMLTLQEFPQVEGVELLGTNGTILITWNEPNVDPEFKNQTITYRLNIIPLDSFGDRKSIPQKSSMHHLFSPHNPSACTTFNISITALLNSFAGLPRHVIGGSYDESPLGTNYSVLVTSVTFNGTELIYEVILSNGEPICYMNLNATHVLSGVAYNIEMKVDTQLNTILTIFTIDNENLPFDEHYNAIVDVYNPPSNISSRLICFNLSTHHIQNSTLNNGLLTMSFVKNTPARGAFLVIGDTKSHCYDYIPIEYLKMNNVTDLEFNISDPDNQISACSSSCTLLVYAIKDDGLPKHNLNSSMMENVIAWPVTEYRNITLSRQDLTSETESDINYGQINDTKSIDAVQVNVSISSESITFTCMVGDDSGDIQGCITIIHSTSNYSALIVNTIDKNSVFSFNRTSESASQVEEYLYAVFPWSKYSGLLGFKVIEKGGTQSDAPPTTNNDSDPDLSPRIIAAIIISIILIMTALIVTIIIIVKVKLNWSKLKRHCLKGNYCNSNPSHEETPASRSVELVAAKKRD